MKKAARFNTPVPRSVAEKPQERPPKNWPIPHMPAMVPAWAIEKCRSSLRKEGNHKEKPNSAMQSKNTMMHMVKSVAANTVLL